MSIKGSRSLAEALSASGALPGKKAARGKKTRAGGKLKVREKDVLAQVLDFLALHRIRAWRQNIGGATLTGGHFIRFAEKGAADVLAVLRPGGRLLCIETKRPGGKLSPAQATWLDGMREQGALCIVVRSVDDLEKALKLEGAL